MSWVTNSASTPAPGGDVRDVHDLLHTAHPHKLIEHQEDRGLDLAPPILPNNRAQNEVDEQAHEDRLLVHLIERHNNEEIYLIVEKIIQPEAGSSQEVAHVV